MSKLVLGLLELIGYKEWTESLGFDREWSIQTIQSNIYAELQKAAASVEAFLIPLSMDNMILVLNGVRERAYNELYETASSLSPVPVGLTIIDTRDPILEVYPRGKPGLHIRTVNPVKPIAAIHVDMNYFSNLRRRTGSIASYIRIIDFYSRVSKKLSGRPAIASYLGGDNLIVFTTPEFVDDVVSIIFESMGEDDYKIGIGVAETPRRALRAAAKALGRLRSNDRFGRIESIRELDE
ncbi:MAG: GTP cyclohydrolase IIa [Pyrodictiaceae archaeon]